MVVVHSRKHVFPPKGYGGGERFAYGLAKAMSVFHNVVLIHFGDKWQTNWQDGVKIITLQNRLYIRARNGRLVSYFNALTSMLELLFAFAIGRLYISKPILYFHGGLEYSVFQRLQMLILPRLKPVYVFRLQSPRSMDPSLLSGWEKILAVPTELYAVTSADLVIFESDAIKQSLSKFWREPRRSLVIPNAVDTEFFDRSRYNNNEMCKMGIFYGASIKRQKNQLGVVRAMAKVVAEESRAKLLLLGDPQELDYFEQVRKEVTRLGLERNVIFLSSTSIDVLNRIRVVYPIHVIYSTYTGFDVTVGETLALGATCVFSDTPPLKGIVKNNVDCVLVPPENPDALSKALIDLLRNEAKSRNLSRAARRTAETKLSFNAFAPVLSEVLCSVVREKE
ncbi:MAG: glycosyltransferase family 4 protein [Conexivisphaerales archaeon]